MLGHPHYDPYFKAYTSHFFGTTLDWLWLKAQAIAESGIDQAAVSPVGARGVMQLMPSTARFMAGRLKLEDEAATMPHINIMFGAGYLHYLFSMWKLERGLERLRFSFGSYNAGPGHILSAQARAKASGIPTDKWASIVWKLPEITGERHSAETIRYVEKIEKHYRQLTMEDGV